MGVPTTFKVFIGLLVLLVITIPFGYYLSVVQPKKAQEEMILAQTINYYYENFRMNEKELIEYFESKGQKFEAMNSPEEAHAKMMELKKIGEPLTSKESKAFQNVNEPLPNLVSMSTLIISYGEKLPLDNKELMAIIDKAKDLGIDTVYSYSNEGFLISHNYYKISKQRYERKRDGIPDLDNHIPNEEETPYPQVFVMSEGRLDIDKTEKIVSKNPSIKVNGSSKGVFIFEK